MVFQNDCGQVLSFFLKVSHYDIVFRSTDWEEDRFQGKGDGSRVFVSLL